MLKYTLKSIVLFAGLVVTIFSSHYAVGKFSYQAGNETKAFEYRITFVEQTAQTNAENITVHDSKFDKLGENIGDINTLLAVQATILTTQAETLRKIERKLE